MGTLRNPAVDPRSGSAVAGLGDTRTGLLLILTGCLPFVLGLVYEATDGAGWISAACPFLTVTGLPCPFCGSTRAFAFASSGDVTFLDYNAIWVFAAAGLAILGLAVTFTRFSLRGFWSRRDNLAVWLAVAGIAAGWVYAFLNRGAIN